ncbi:MAG: hypothetical protein NT126_00835 [Bacteroidetes bacterium]|nr:hypothetical protein [Bacteroidota bacterium]
MAHYEIDSVKNLHAHTEVIKMYEDNVSINKTEYESVKIETWDTDPVIASAMIDSIIRLGDLKARSLQRGKSHEVLVIAKSQLDLKKAEMDSMENLLKSYSLKYGLLDYKIQIKEYSRAYARSLASGSGRGQNEAKTMLKTLAEQGEDFNALNEHLWRVRGTYNDLKIAYLWPSVSLPRCSLRSWFYWCSVQENYFRTKSEFFPYLFPFTGRHG